MNCPSCGLHHPSFYTHCISCGTLLSPGGSKTVRGPVVHAAPFVAVPQIPPSVGIGIAIGILVICAAVTLFLLRPSDESVLYDKAQKELSSGRYAFAAQQLEQLAVRRPGDPKVFLALARAYVGVDQVDRAWAAIARAQQLGAGVIADPTLTYQLATYYRQQGSYDRALQLLRPLASANVADARTQLADLDASWGDAQIDTNIEQAMHCWEEVQSLNTGSRLSEAPARLATIYQRYADKLIAQGDDKNALTILDKLNAVAQNPLYHEMTADVYERMGLFDKACDQLRTAISLAGPQSNLNVKLAAMLTKYGKQLLDSGDTERGCDCLQQAADLDKTITVPLIVLKDVSVAVNPVDRHAQMWSSVFNAGHSPVGHIKVDVQLISIATSKVLWQSSRSIIGEYDLPLAPQDSKLIKFDAIATVRSNGATAFNVSINNQFYKSYPIGKKLDNANSQTQHSNAPDATENQSSVPVDTQSEAANHSQLNGAPETNTPKIVTPEDQTLKDLER